MRENEGVQKTLKNFGHSSKTTDPNELKFRVEVDFSHRVEHKKNSGHLDYVLRHHNVAARDKRILHLTCKARLLSQI